jgi:hydroxymethylglutaryl-CoA synthase
MGVEAARRALGDRQVLPRGVWFATAAPTYLDKTNAAALHAALRLDRDVAAYDALGSVRSAFGALAAGLSGTASALVVTSDVRFGLPGGTEESSSGDGAAAVLVGDDSTAPVLAEVIGRTSLTEEFVDRWRQPSLPTSQLWEERFGETRYVPLAHEALTRVLKQARLEVGDISALVVAGLHERACTASSATSASRSHCCCSRRRSRARTPATWWYFSASPMGPMQSPCASPRRSLSIGRGSRSALRSAAVRPSVTGDSCRGGVR